MIRFWSIQLSCVRAYCISADEDEGRLVSVPTHHQRLGRDRVSLPNVSPFLRYPRRVRRYLSRDLYREDSFQAHYVLFYTYNREAYHESSKAIEDRLFEQWYGEIIVFRKGKGGGDVVNLDKRRGDTDRVIWSVIEKYVPPTVAHSRILMPHRFIAQYRP